MNPSVYPTASSPQPTGASSMGFSSGLSATSPARRQGAFNRKKIVNILVFLLILVLSILVAYNIFSNQNKKHKRAELSEVIKQNINSVEELESNLSTSFNNRFIGLFSEEGHKSINNGINSILNIKNSLDKNHPAIKKNPTSNLTMRILLEQTKKYSAFIENYNKLYSIFSNKNISELQTLSKNSQYPYAQAAEILSEWLNIDMDIARNLSKSQCNKSQSIKNNYCRELFLKQEKHRYTLSNGDIFSSLPRDYFLKINYSNDMLHIYLYTFNEELIKSNG